MHREEGLTSKKANLASRGVRARIIGVDPGLIATGFGIIELERSGEIAYLTSGVIRPRIYQAFAQRLQQIFQGLCQQIESYSPNFMAVERPFYAKNVKSAMLLGQARGVAILAAAEAKLPVQEFSPLEVKQAVVGYGRAAKEQVQVMIKSLLHTYQILATDASDALAVAICLAHSLPWQKSMMEETIRRKESSSLLTPQVCGSRSGFGDEQ